MFTWDPTMSAGIDSLDEQHKELIMNLNQLNLAMSQGRADKDISGLLNFLDTYVRKHFTEEEVYMRLHKCPAMIENQKAHAAFLKSLKEIKTEFEQKGSHARLIIKVQRKLVEWFFTHIKKIDTHLLPCVKK